MCAKRAKVSTDNVTFLIESCGANSGDDPDAAQLTFSPTGGRGSVGAKELSTEVLQQLGKIIDELSSNLRGCGRSALLSLEASEGELELKLGFDESVSLWVVNTGASQSITVRFKWVRL